MNGTRGSENLVRENSKRLQEFDLCEKALLLRRYRRNLGQVPRTASSYSGGEPSRSHGADTRWQRLEQKEEKKADVHRSWASRSGLCVWNFSVKVSEQIFCLQ